jgi:hypothetical protein
MTTQKKKIGAKRAKRPTANGVMNGAAPKKTNRPRLNNAKLVKLAEKYRPPQSWYDEEHNLF